MRTLHPVIGRVWYVTASDHDYPTEILVPTKHPDTEFYFRKLFGTRFYSGPTRRVFEGLSRDAASRSPSPEEKP